VRALLISFVLLLAACAQPVAPLPFVPASATAAPDPSKLGPYAVGVRTQTIEDTGRKKPDGGARLLVTEVWYPAAVGTTGEGATYDLTDSFTDEHRRQMADAGVVLPILETSAVRDAAPDQDHGPYPLIVFSHGQGGIRWQSTFYTVALASHGYVVVAPDHEGGTMADAVRNELEPALIGFDHRPQDVRVLIQRFSKLNAADPLFGLLDLNHVGVTGHSFGALTSLRVAVLDDRVKAIVPMAPTSTDIAWIGFDPKPVLTIPVQIQGGGKDQTLDYAEHVQLAWNDMKRPRWLLDILEGGHFTFSDLCEFDLGRVLSSVTLDIPGAGNVQEVLDDGCIAPAPPPSVAQPLMNHFAIGFFNGTLRGSSASLDLLTQEKANALAPGAASVVAEP
jgi:predicted dienelactone hydrolase